MPFRKKLNQCRCHRLFDWEQITNTLGRRTINVKNNHNITITILHTTQEHFETHLLNFTAVSKVKPHAHTPPAAISREITDTKRDSNTIKRSYPAQHTHTATHTHTHRRAWGCCCSLYGNCMIRYSG